MKSKGLKLGNGIVSDDPAYQRVIDSQAKLKEAQRKIKALEKDREQLLSEYTDYRNARPLRKAPTKKRKSRSTERLRVAVGDLHGQRMDRQAVDAFLVDLKILDPDEIILGGDMVECGGWLAKHQTVGFVALSDYSYQEDIEAANWFLDEIQKRAPHAEITFLEGNHEDRVERWCVDQTLSHQRDSEFLREAFSPRTLLRLDDRGIEYIRRSVIYVEGLPRGWIKRGKMFFTHELAGGKNAASRAADRAAANVTQFHTHKSDSSTRVFPGVGLVKAFCPGCLCQMQPVWKHSDPSSWNHGYDVDVIAKSGNFQRIQIPIWKGSSLAGSMIERFSK